MADPQQNYRNVLSRLEAKDKQGTSAQDLYDAASFLPGTGEAIAAYELPGILSQSGEMIQSDDFLEAAAGTGLATLGIASVLPMVGPAAKAARKGLEGFIPYMGPKLATEGPDSSIMAMTDFEPPKGGTKAADDIDLGSGSLFAPESKKGKQLLVLSCSSTKCPDVGDMKAVDRYLGPVFQSLKKQGVPDNVDVAILSAKHGLIRADTKIKDYDQLMDTNRASEFKQDAGQMDRIKNTLEGYDKVVVQGGKNYKDVIRAASGDANVTEIPGGRGIGDQRKSVKSALAFSKIDTPVYHYTPASELGFTTFDPDKAVTPLDALGVHVGTKKAAADRFEDLNRLDLASGSQKVTGNLGVDEAGNFIPKTTRGGTYPLLADTSKPFSPKTVDNKRFQGATEWSEFDLTEHLIDEFNKTLPKGVDFDGYYTMKHLSAEPGYEDFPFAKFRDFVKGYRKKLSKEGFTHIPYINDVEDYSSTSFIMLVDRPKGSTKVLQSPFAKKDPAAADDPDIMKAEGGVVSMKDRAVNINRGPRGIEPFVQYFDSGGVVQSVKDYIGSFFEEEPIVPERNVFEEQRIVAENSPYPKDIPIVQTEKEALSDLADREMGLELINRVGFDPLAYKIMQAGLRDNRTLSDFLEIYPTVTTDMTEKEQKDALTDKIRGLGLASGMYFPLDNMVVVEPMDTAISYFQSPTDMIIMHEVLHKGAETLKKDPNVNIKTLREKLDAGDYENIGDDTKSGRAEHRYIQAIVNKAYLDNMLTNSSIYANRELARAEKTIKDPNARVGEKIVAESNIKNIPKYIDRDKKQDIIKEIRRSTEMYLEPTSKEVFKKHMEILHPGKGLFDRDKVYVEENFNLNELKQIYDTLNMIMLNEPGTKEFALEMSKAAPAGASIRGYSDLFPQQFADPVRPYEKTYTDVTPDMSYIDVMRERDKFLRKARKKREAEENKAEGGVIGLKDKAVNMYRNRL